MRYVVLFTCLVFLAAADWSKRANAHDMPWRDGESRQLNYGHCSKGACMKRTCWAPSRPHRHVNGRVVIKRYGGAECWARNIGNDEFRLR